MAGNGQAERLVDAGGHQHSMERVIKSRNKADTCSRSLVGADYIGTCQAPRRSFPRCSGKFDHRTSRKSAVHPDTRRHLHNRSALYNGNQGCMALRAAVVYTNAPAATRGERERNFSDSRARE